MLRSESSSSERSIEDIQNQIRSVCPWSLGASEGDEELIQEQLLEISNEAVQGITKAHYSLVGAYHAAGRLQEAERLLHTTVQFALRARKIDPRSVVLLPVLGERAVSHLVSNRPHQAAVDYLHCLFDVSTNFDPQCPEDVVSDLKYRFAFNAALAYRRMFSFGFAESVIYCPFGLNPMLPSSFLSQQLPRRLRAVVELCRAVRCCSSAEELIAFTVILSSHPLNTSPEPGQTAALFALVQLCTHHYLSRRVLSGFSTDPTEIDLAVANACDELVLRISNGQTSAQHCMSDGIPPSLSNMDRVLRHALVATLDFCVSYRTFEMWSAVQHEKRGEEASVPEGLLSNANMQMTWSFDSLPVLPPLYGPQDIEVDLLSQIVHEVLLVEPLPIYVSPTFRFAEGSTREATPDPSPVSTTPPPETDVENWEEAVKEFIPDVVGFVDQEPLLSPLRRNTLHGVLPFALQHHHWCCLYSTTQHGFSMKTLLSNVADADGVLLLVQNASNTYGAFLAETLRLSSRYCGGAESFVFSFQNASGDASEESADLSVYRWTQRNEYFSLCKPGEGIVIGGGPTGSAILLHNDLFTGNSYPCQTFDSPPLAPTDEGTGFDVFRVEIYGFTPLSSPSA